MKQICDVSIVIPAYNADRFVIPALESIVRQTCDPREVLIIDDGSSDKTYSIVEEWIKKTSPPFPVQLFTQANRGSSATRNLGIERASSQWVALMDVDDIWEPVHLEELFNAAAHCPKAIAAYGSGKLLEGDKLQEGLYDDFWDNPSVQYGQPVDESKYLKIDIAVFSRLIKGNFIKPSSLMFLREIALRSGLFDASLRTGEDREFLVRLIFKGPFIYTPTPITQYRWHDDNLSQIKNAKTNLENGLRVLEKIIKNRSLALTVEQLNACQNEISSTSVAYLYVSAKTGFLTYLGALSVVRHLFGITSLVAVLNIKHLIHAILPSPKSST